MRLSRFEFMHIIYAPTLSLVCTICSVANRQTRLSLMKIMFCPQRMIFDRFSGTTGAEYFLIMWRDFLQCVLVRVGATNLDHNVSN
jgi:hypothetical protein